jgi:hypothetical protein
MFIVKNKYVGMVYCYNFYFVVFAGDLRMLSKRCYQKLSKHRLCPMIMLVMKSPMTMMMSPMTVMMMVFRPVSIQPALCMQNLQAHHHRPALRALSGLKKDNAPHVHRWNGIRKLMRANGQMA